MRCRISSVPQITDIINEGRAYKIPMVMAHQETAQIGSNELKEAMEAAKTQVYFCTTLDDGAQAARTHRRRLYGRAYEPNAGLQLRLHLRRGPPGNGYHGTDTKKTPKGPMWPRMSRR